MKRSIPPEQIPILTNKELIVIATDWNFTASTRQLAEEVLQTRMRKELSRASYTDAV